MNITPLQANFSAGELSPLMINRTELEGHAAAVEIMENVIALSQGPAKNRDPFTFVNEFTGETFGRVETLQLSTNRFLIAAFLDLSVHFFLSDGSPVLAGHAANPRFSLFGQGWDIITAGPGSTVFFDRHICVCTPQLVGVGNLAGIRQTVTITETGEDHEFHVHSDVETATDELHILVGTTLGGGELVDAIITVNASITLFDPAGNDTLFIEVRNENNGGAPGDNPVTLSAVDIINANASGQVDVTPYPSNELTLLQFVEAPEGDTVFITHPRFTQHFILFDDIIGSVTFDPVVFTAPPAEWAGFNFPATGVVHKGRIYYAGTPNEPEQIWAGVVGDFTDMTIGATEEDGFSVVNSHFGAIQWMLSTKDLIFGSANAEYLITAQGPVIFIGDIQIDRQSTYGSVNIRGQHIGDKVLYITRGAKRLHAMQFNRDAATWLSDEISFPSEHIMKAGAKEMVWEQNPHDLIWMTLVDGTLACCSYNRPMEIYGWHRHNTQGIVVDVATGDEGGNSVLVALVLREGGDLKLEVTRPTGAPVDSRVTRQLPPDTSTVPDLEHLEGLTVQVVADGAVHPDRVVVGGEIELQLNAEFVQVGLGYRKRIKTLPADKGSPKGSARAYVKRYKDIYIALLDSAVPFINNQLPPIREPGDLMNVAPPFVTGLVKVQNLGYDREAIVDLIQDGPLPLQITGIYGEIVQEKL